MNGKYKVTDLVKTFVVIKVIPMTNFLENSWNEISLSNETQISHGLYVIRFFEENFESFEKILKILLN